jgi:nucleotide-binding universal stress UspA family protein
MYKRILIPTDGSEASQRAILAGVEFAREVGAEVVGLTATPEFSVLSTDSDMLEDTPEQYAAASAARARRASWATSSPLRTRPGCPAAPNTRSTTIPMPPSSPPPSAPAAT